MSQIECAWISTFCVLTVTQYTYSELNKICCLISTTAFLVKGECLRYLYAWPVILCLPKGWPEEMKCCRDIAVKGRPNRYDSHVSLFTYSWQIVGEKSFAFFVLFPSSVCNRLVRYEEFRSYSQTETALNRRSSRIFSYLYFPLFLNKNIKRREIQCYLFIYSFVALQSIRRWCHRTPSQPGWW